MYLDTLRMAFDYNWWVTRRLLDTAEQVPQEQARQTFGMSFGSVHGTLAHLLGSEVTWLRRWQGNDPGKRPMAEDFASVAEMRVPWEQHDADRRRFLGELTPERLEAPARLAHASGAVLEVPLGQLMLHVITHSAHHRSEVADMLTRLGYPPKPTYMVAYWLEKQGVVVQS